MPPHSPGRSHRLGSVEKASDEAKRFLQSNTDRLKMRQEEVRGEMKNYRKLMEELNTENTDTMVEMRRHKEGQVTRDNPVLWLYF